MESELWPISLNYIAFIIFLTFKFPLVFCYADHITIWFILCLVYVSRDREELYWLGPTEDADRVLPPKRYFWIKKGYHCRNIHTRLSLFHYFTIVCYAQACLIIFLFLLSFLAHLNFFFNMILSRCSWLLVLKSYSFSFSSLLFLHNILTCLKNYVLAVCRWWKMFSMWLWTLSAGK
jgi:hypothetical protein